MGTDYSVIESKLIQFIQKYYLSKLIKGLIFTALIFIIISISLVLIEYFSYLSVSKKTVFLIFYLLVLLVSFTFYIVLPLLGFLGIRIKIGQNQINSIVVSHFPEIKDQLWNLLEFKEFNKEDSVSEDLVLASIEQRISSIKHFNFKEAVELKHNLKFLYLLIAVVALTTLFSILAPNVINDSGKRLKNFTTSYVKPSPYTYILLNDKLEVGKGDNFTLKVRIDTDKAYENLFLHYGGNTYLMRQDSLDYYSYKFTNINNSLQLNLAIDDYLSDSYELKVLSKPILSAFNIKVNKPNYTNLQNENFENITELMVPVGSKCSFQFFTYDTDTILLKDQEQNVYRLSEDFIWSSVFTSNSILSVSLKNKHFEEIDFFKIEIQTIQDDYPSIAINQIIDSTDYTRVYFKGQIEDDYGFNALNFICKIDTEIDTVLVIDVLPNLLQQDFFYAFDFEIFKGVSKQIDYYFELLDNDVINGPKTSVSEYFTFIFPDAKDVFDFQEEQFDNIEEIVSESMNLTQELKKDLMELKEKMINSDLTDWERKEIMKDVFSKKQDLEKALKEIQEKNEEMNNYMESFTEQNQELLEKQEEIQNILEEVMSDELKQLMEEFNSMMEQFNQNKMNELTEKMDVSLDDLSAQLDKNLELLKRMKIEKQLDLITSDLDKHIEKQEALSDLIEQGSKPEDLIEQQKNEQAALKELKEQYKKVEEINKELEMPLDIYNFEKEFQDIDQEFNKSLDQQQKNNKKKSKESMQQNRSNMENLAFMMKQMKEAAFEEQQGESLANLLQILDNTIIFSFEQENLLDPTTAAEMGNQFFTQQKKLYQDFKVIKDSLYALAKREPAVNMAVNKEIVAIENNFNRIDKDLTENRISQAKINQQNVLTSANNLSLFLSEVIKQLQNQMANSQPGDQNCEKPGNNPNPNSMGNSMKSMQQSLQKQLEKMMQMMKDGKSGQEMGGEMGKALSQQEKMQNMMQQMMNQGNVGSGAFETLKEAEQLLNKVREDIIRNNLSNQTVERQKEILTRLLEAENAENEREIDKKRKSESAEQNRISETAKQFDNNVSNNNFKEKLIKQKLVLKKYYQKKYQNYVNQLDSINGAEY